MSVKSEKGRVISVVGSHSRAEVDEWKVHSEQLALTTWAVGLDTTCAVRAS